MSHTRVKIKYEEEGAYGSTEEHTLYCWLNHSCDVVSFYDEKGECILSFGDDSRFNIFKAMNALLRPFKNNTELEDGIEFMSREESQKCGIA
jgi:hypothetical protein